MGGMATHSWWPLPVAVATAGAAILAVAVWPQSRGAAAVPRQVAVVVPGGGLTAEGRPTEWVRRRLEEAARLHRERRAAGQACAVVTLSGGTPHKPMPIDPETGFQVFEAEANARSLIMEFGVPPEDIFEEGWSVDTVGNAYMFRAAHADVAGWRHIVVVNNEFHMGRTRAIFEKVFSLKPTPSFGAYVLQFVEVSNNGLQGEALAARREREANSTVGFRRNTAAITTMREMHAFLFSEHLAYASRRLLKDREPVDPKALQSY